MNNKSKFISILLSVALIFSICSVWAFAIIGTNKTGGIEFASGKVAIAASQSFECDDAEIDTVGGKIIVETQGVDTLSFTQTITVENTGNIDAWVTLSLPSAIKVNGSTKYTTYDIEVICDDLIYSDNAVAGYEINDVDSYQFETSSDALEYFVNTTTSKWHTATYSKSVSNPDVTFRYEKYHFEKPLTSGEETEITVNYEIPMPSGYTFFDFYPAVYAWQYKYGYIKEDFSNAYYNFWDYSLPACENNLFKDLKNLDNFAKQ